MLSVKSTNVNVEPSSLLRILNSFYEFLVLLFVKFFNINTLECKMSEFKQLTDFYGKAGGRAVARHQLAVVIRPLAVVLKLS